MALGVTKTAIGETWELVLQKGDLPEHINDWNDNSWLIEHLRYLANKLEEERPRDNSIGFTMDSQYKAPRLILEVFPRR